MIKASLGMALTLALCLGTVPAWANGQSHQHKHHHHHSSKARAMKPRPTLPPPMPAPLLIPRQPLYTPLQTAARICEPFAQIQLGLRHGGVDRVQLVPDPRYMLHGYAQARIDRDIDGLNQLSGVGMYRDWRGWQYMRFDCRYQNDAVVRFGWQEEGNLVRNGDDVIYRNH